MNVSSISSAITGSALTEIYKTSHTGHPPRDVQSTLKESSSRNSILSQQVIKHDIRAAAPRIMTSIATSEESALKEHVEQMNRVYLTELTDVNIRSIRSASTINEDEVAEQISNFEDKLSAFKLAKKRMFFQQHREQSASSWRREKSLWKQEYRRIHELRNKNCFALQLEAGALISAKLLQRCKASQEAYRNLLQAYKRCRDAFYVYKNPRNNNFHNFSPLVRRYQDTIIDFFDARGIAYSENDATLFDTPYEQQLVTQSSLFQRSKETEWNYIKARAEFRNARADMFSEQDKEKGAPPWRVGAAHRIESLTRGEKSYLPGRADTPNDSPLQRKCNAYQRALDKLVVAFKSYKFTTRAFINFKDSKLSEQDFHPERNNQRLRNHYKSYEAEFDREVLRSGHSEIVLEPMLFSFAT